MKRLKPGHAHSSQNEVAGAVIYLPLCVQFHFQLKGCELFVLCVV